MVKKMYNSEKYIGDFLLKCVFRDTFNFSVRNNSMLRSRR